MGCTLCWHGVAVSCTPVFLESWPLQGVARTGQSLLLSRSVCVVYLSNKATDLLLVYPHSASAAIHPVMSNSVLLHQGEAVTQVARAQPLPRLTASVSSCLLWCLCLTPVHWQKPASTTQLLSSSVTTPSSPVLLNRPYKLGTTTSSWETVMGKKDFAVGINNFIWEIQCSNDKCSCL